jgi:hypothetical protein
MGKAPVKHDAAFLDDDSEASNVPKLVILGLPFGEVSTAMDAFDGFTACSVIGSVVECDGVQLHEDLSDEREESTRQSTRLTFEVWTSMIPTRSHMPMKWRPRFAPLCSPEMLRNPITSDLNSHFPSLTSIQCPVTPRNPAFVVATDQLSAVVETFPGAAWNVM